MKWYILQKKIKRPFAPKFPYKINFGENFGKHTDE